MSKGVSERIQQQRTQIRRAQMHSLFSSKRELMMTIPKQHAIEILMPQLQRIRHFVIYEESMEQCKEGLQRIRQIMSQYQIINELIRKIEFQSNLADLKFGALAHEMNWMDLFVWLLRNFSEDPAISQRCSFILMQCAICLRTRRSKNMALQTQNPFQIQTKRLLDNYPYLLLLEQQAETIEYSLFFVVQLLQSCTDGTFIYDLVTKQTPNILVMLNSLAENDRVLEIESVQDAFVSASITVLYYVQHYNYVKFEESEYLFLVDRIKKMTLKNLLQPRSEDNFLLGCQQLRIITHQRGLKLLQNEFEEVQQMLQRQLANDHASYFRLLQTIMYNFTFLLKPKSIKVLFSSLFDTDGKTGNNIEFKSMLIDLISYQVINNGNRFREEDAEIFMFSWGEYTKVDRLLRLVQLLDNCETAERPLKTIFELILKLMNGDSPEHSKEMISFLEDELESLLSFQAFKELLEQYNFQVV